MQGLEETFPENIKIRKQHPIYQGLWLHCSLKWWVGTSLQQVKSSSVITTLEFIFFFLWVVSFSKHSLPLPRNFGIDTANWVSYPKASNGLLTRMDDTFTLLKKNCSAHEISELDYLGFKSHSGLTLNNPMKTIFNFFLPLRRFLG